MREANLVFDRMSHIISRLEHFELALRQISASVDGLKAQLFEVELNLGVMQVKMAQNEEKLDGIKSGLADFSSDVHVWLNPGQEDATMADGGSIPKSGTASETDSNLAEEVDVLRYLDQGAISLDFE